MLVLLFSFFLLLLIIFVFFVRAMSSPEKYHLKITIIIIIIIIIFAYKIQKYVYFMDDSTHVQYVHRLRYVNSVCSFACPLSLWPERVVACRVSSSSVSSGCAKLLFVEFEFPDLFFQNELFNVAITLTFFIHKMDAKFQTYD